MPVPQRLYEGRIMTPPDLSLTRQELVERADHLRSRMADAQLDALLLTTGDNLRYVSGYPSPARSGPRPFIFILPIDHDPVFIVHSGREAEAQTLSWAQDIRTYYRLSRAPVETIAVALRDCGLDGARVGVEIGTEQCMNIPFSDFIALQQRLPETDFVDSAPTLWGARMRKSPAEIARLRRACHISSSAFERCCPEFRAGMAEREIARMLTDTMIELGATDTWLLLTAGVGNYDMVSRGPSSRTVEPGDMVYIDAGCAIEGYWSDFDRTGVAGGPSPRQLEAQRFANEVTHMAVSMVGPGANTRDIALACKRALADFPFPITSDIGQLAARVGHGEGLAIVEPPNVAEYEDTILEEGMVITIKPGVATEFGVFHIEQDVLVTAEGSEILSTAPTEIWTIPG